uniref:MSDIN-like toxin proprotein 6 n=1 Tax=Amanita bisporigera TaxID=87325 RepID=MSD6_AMABI|nr:RecName: Full=MSDIN-like toxin proprotein 6; Contains: RecName: Full=Toxin MSD6; Flags: Precursor [Amanita bisporigera]ABW87778.1 putative MSDIN-like protein 6 [Amanita bisporigera]
MSDINGTRLPIPGLIPLGIPCVSDDVNPTLTRGER